MGQQNNNNGKKDGRYQFLLANHGPQIFKHLQKDQHGKTFGNDVESAFETFAKLDPTHDAKGKQYGYLQWLCTQYLKTFEEGNTPIAAQDLQKISGDIAFFIALKKRRKHDKFEKDLNKHTPESLADLKDEYLAQEAINPLLRELRKDIRKETTVFYDGPEGIIISPETKKASEFWGEDTSWCTAKRDNNSYFQNHVANGKLVIFIPQTSPIEDSREYRKFQAYYNTTIKHAGNESFRGMPANLGELIHAAITKDPAMALFMCKECNIEFDRLKPADHTKDSWLYVINRFAESNESVRAKDVYHHIPDAMYEDEAFCIDAIQTSDSIHYLSQKYRTPAVYLKALGLADNTARPKILKEMALRFGNHYYDQLCKEQNSHVRDVLKQSFPKSLQGAEDYFKITPEEFWLDNDFCENVLERNSNENVMAKIPATFWHDEERVCRLIESKPSMFFAVPEAARSKPVYLAVLGKNPEKSAKIMESVPDSFWHDEEFKLDAINTDANRILYIPSEQRTIALYKKALNRLQHDEYSQRRVASDISAELLHDQELALEIVKIEPETFDRVQDPSPEICLAAMKSAYASKYPEIVSRIPPSHYHDTAFARDVVSRCHKAYINVPEEHRTTNLALLAVSNIKTTTELKEFISYMPDDFWRNETLAVKLIEKNPSLFTLTPAEYRTRDATLAAFKSGKVMSLSDSQKREIIRVVPSKHWHDIDICYAARDFSDTSKFFMPRDIQQAVFPSFAQRAFNSLFGDLDAPATNDNRRGQNDYNRPERHGNNGPRY